MGTAKKGVGEIIVIEGIVIEGIFIEGIVIEKKVTINGLTRLSLCASYLLSK